MKRPRPVPRAVPLLVPAEATVWTLGHSTRTWEAFLALLEEHTIERLVDVRHFPSSAHVPWTNRDALAKRLEASGIAYEHIVALGGFRTPRPDSVNVGWRNAGFRGYADYMGTPEFEAALERLVVRAKEARTAIMCAEAVPWRCHRGLLSDALLVRGVRVVHILSSQKTQEHALAPFARVIGGHITYPRARGKA